MLGCCVGSIYVQTEYVHLRIYYFVRKLLTLNLLLLKQNRSLHLEDLILGCGAADPINGAARLVAEPPIRAGGKAPIISPFYQFSFIFWFLFLLVCTVVHMFWSLLKLIWSTGLRFGHICSGFLACNAS